MEKPVSVKNHSELDKVSYESARQKKQPENKVSGAFMTGLDERVHTTPYVEDSTTSRIKAKRESTQSKKTNDSAIPMMNPVCDKIDADQTGP
jgi:predicted ATPase with chaperone activity